MLAMRTAIFKVTTPHNITCVSAYGWPPVKGAALQALANNDYVVLDVNRFGADLTKDVIDSLYKKNLAIEVGAYLPSFMVYGWMKKAADLGELTPNTFGYDWWNELSPYLARTDSLNPGTAISDTAAAWLNDYTINMLIPEARIKMVLIASKYLVGRVDWLMLDFLTVPLPDLKVWQGLRYQQQEHGDLDMDQNGIPQYIDVAEQVALRTAFIDYIMKLRVAFPGVKIISNGWLAVRDSEVAKLVDGIMLERFPLEGWGFSFVNALNPINPIGLPNLCAKNRYAINPGIVMINDAYKTGQLTSIAAKFPSCAVWTNVGGVK